MHIQDFQYFNNQQVTGTGSAGPVSGVSPKDLDLDLQTVNRAAQENGAPVVQGSGWPWCHITESGAICTTIVCVSLAECK